MANTFYNRAIRKLVVGFGNLFNEITLVRYNTDLTEQERFLVPIAYASKEDYVLRLQGDPDADKKVQMTLPRMSFEMTGFSYDATRKQNTNIKNFAQTAQGVSSQYNPVPYNFDFNLYLYVRNIEDGAQIIEHILPYFTPDYTIKLNFIPELGIVKEVPIILNSTTNEVTTEGGRDKETRTVIWTLNFTAKGFIFGPVTEPVGLITHTITSIYSQITPNDGVEFYITPSSGQGDYQRGEFVYQGYSLNTGTAVGKVQDWSNTAQILTLSQLTGNFTPSLPLIGSYTNAKFNYTTVSKSPQKLAQIDIIPNPANANATDNYTYNTYITENPLQPLKANQSYVICTSNDYGQVRGYRVQIVGDTTFINGSTLTDGTYTRTITGTESDGVGFTIALVSVATPTRWINGSGALRLILTTP
jgi:hypothetical protein